MNLIEEGIDAALRIAHLPDSSMVAIRVGEVRQVVVATPSFLARHPRIETPCDLVKHQIIAVSQAGLNSWRFPPTAGSATPQIVQFTPRCVVNSMQAAIASAVEGRGVTRLFSHQVAKYVRDGRLQIVLRPYEHAPVPVHLVMPEGRLSMPKVRAFADLAVARLRAQFASLAVDAPA
jgi:DNA-binding transcriptional LysR family regulator